MCLLTFKNNLRVSLDIASDLLLQKLYIPWIYFPLKIISPQKAVSVWCTTTFTALQKRISRKRYTILQYEFNVFNYLSNTKK